MRLRELQPAKAGTPTLILVPFVPATVNRAYIVVENALTTRISTFRISTTRISTTRISTSRISTTRILLVADLRKKSDEARPS